VILAVELAGIGVYGDDVGYQLACFERRHLRAPISACAEWGKCVVSAAIVHGFGLVHHPFSENRIGGFAACPNAGKCASKSVIANVTTTSAALNEYLRISLSPLNRQMCQVVPGAT